MLYLIPLILTMLIIPLTLIGIDKPVGEIIGDITTVVGGYEDTAKRTYLFTQFRVVVTYIRLLFLPINQNIDYDYPVYHSFFTPQVFLSFLFLLSIFGFTVYLLLRSKSSPILRLIAFGVFWFFIALSVESSIIPIPMVINEYRVYLPSIGVFTAIMTGAFLSMERLKSKKTQTAILSFLILIPFALSSATYARNAVWRSEISLWEDVIKKSPHRARGYNNLGIAYSAKGLTAKATEQYQIVLKLRPDLPAAHYNLGNVYHEKGLIDKAIEQYQIALRLKPDFVEAWNNKGTTLGGLGRYEEAINAYEKAIELKPDFAVVWYNRAWIYALMSEKENTLMSLSKAIELDGKYREIAKEAEHFKSLWSDKDFRRIVE